MSITTWGFGTGSITSLGWGGAGGSGLRGTLFRPRIKDTKQLVPGVYARSHDLKPTIKATTQLAPKIGGSDSDD